MSSLSAAPLAGALVFVIRVPAPIPGGPCQTPIIAPNGPPRESPREAPASGRPALIPDFLLPPPTDFENIALERVATRSENISRTSPDLGGIHDRQGDFRGALRRARWVLHQRQDDADGGHAAHRRRDPPQGHDRPGQHGRRSFAGGAPAPDERRAQHRALHLPGRPLVDRRLSRFDRAGPRTQHRAHGRRRRRDRGRAGTEQDPDPGADLQVPRRPQDPASPVRQQDGQGRGARRRAHGGAAGGLVQAAGATPSADPRGRRGHRLRRPGERARLPLQGGRVLGPHRDAGGSQGPRRRGAPGNVGIPGRLRR